MGSGGFLAGAAQTAMGVAGGVLLGSAIAGMFGGSDSAQAEAADAGQGTEPPADAQYAGLDESGYEDGGDLGGGDFGDI